MLLNKEGPWYVERAVLALANHKRFWFFAHRVIRPAPWLVLDALPWRNSPGGLQPRAIKAPLFSLISQFISFQYSQCIQSKVVIKLKTSSRSFPDHLPRPASGKNVIVRERGVISFFISLTGEGLQRREVEPESLTSWTLTLQR